MFFPYAHGAYSNNKCRGTGDPLVLYSFFWVLNFMQKIWFLLQLGRRQKKSKSSQRSIEKKYCALHFYFSADSIQKLPIFLTAVLIKEAQNCLQTIFNFSPWLAVGYVFFSILDPCRRVQVKQLEIPKENPQQVWE